MNSDFRIKSLLILLVAVVLSRSDSGTWRIFNNYQNVNHVVETADTLWVTTLAQWNTNYGSIIGVSRIDGSRTFLNRFNSPVPSNYIRAFCIDSDGTKYIGTDNGLTIWNREFIKTYNSQNSEIPSSDVSCLSIDKKGWIWIGTYRGVAKLRNDSMVVSPSNFPAQDSPINSIFVDSANNKWINVYGEIYRYNDTAYTNYGERTLGMPLGPISSMAQDTNGIYWFTSFYKSILSFDGRQWTIYDSAQTGIPQYSVNAVVVDKNNNKWFATHLGLLKYDDSIWSRFVPPQSSIPVHFQSIICSSDGSLVLGSSNGIVTFKQDTWLRTDIANSGMPPGGASSVVTDNKGRKWIGTSNGVVSYNDTTWVLYDSTNSSFIGSGADNLRIGPDGAIWCTTSRGINRFKQNQWMSWTNQQLSLPNFLTGFFVDSSNMVWIGTYENNVVRFNSELALGSREQTRSMTEATSFVQVSRSFLLVGVHDYGGIIGFDNGQVHMFPRVSGYLPCACVNDIAQDLDGSIWAATEYEGVQLLRDSTWSSYKGLTANSVRHVAVDALGNKWFGSESGVSKLGDSGWVSYYPANSGIIEPMCWGISADSSGAVWFGTRGGLSVYYPKNAKVGAMHSQHNTPLRFGPIHVARIGKNMLEISVNSDLSARISAFNVAGRNMGLLYSGRLLRGANRIRIENSIISAFSGGCVLQVQAKSKVTVVKFVNIIGK